MKPINKKTKLTYKGKSATLEQWADIKDIPIRKLLRRVEQGWPADHVIEGRPWRSKTKVDRVRITYKGRTKTIDEWAEEVGISKHTMLTRRSRGWPARDILYGRVGVKTSQQTRLYKKLNAEYEGKMLPLKDIAEATGIQYQTIRYRHLNGLDLLTGGDNG